METLSLIIGYIGTAIGVVAYQIKKRERLLVFQIIGNLLPAISFLLLGPDKMIGGLVAFVGSCHTLVAYFAIRKGGVPSRGQTVLFIGLYAVASLLPALLNDNLQLPRDLCPFMCGFFFSLALRAPTVNRARLFYLLGSVPWLFYDVIGDTVAVANLVTHTIALLSAAIAILRYDLLPTKKTATRDQNE